MQPEFTEDYLKKTFNVNSYEDFREKIKNKLIDQYTLDNKIKVQNEIIDYLVDKSVFILKEKDIQDQFLQQLEFYKKAAELYGVSFEEYVLIHEKMDIEFFIEKCRNESIKNLKILLLVDHIWLQMTPAQKISSIENSEIKIEEESIEDISSEAKRITVYQFLLNNATKKENKR